MQGGAPVADLVPSEQLLLHHCTAVPRSSCEFLDFVVLTNHSFPERP